MPENGVSDGLRLPEDGSHLQALNTSLDGWLPRLDNVASGPGWLVWSTATAATFVRYRGQ
jgi:hypothetical protein